MARDDDRDGEDRREDKSRDERENKDDRDGKGDGDRKEEGGRRRKRKSLWDTDVPEGKTGEEVDKSTAKYFGAHPMTIFILKNRL